MAADVGGVRDLMGEIDERSINGYKLGQNGILIPSRNAEILAKALLYLSENREFIRRMGNQGRQSVLNRYSMGRLIGDMDALYRELVSFHP